MSTQRDASKNKKEKSNPEVKKSLSWDKSAPRWAQTRIEQIEKPKAQPKPEVKEDKKKVEQKPVAKAQTAKQDEKNQDNTRVKSSEK